MLGWAGPGLVLGSGRSWAWVGLCVGLGTGRSWFCKKAQLEPVSSTRPSLGPLHFIDWPGLG